MAEKKVLQKSCRLFTETTRKIKVKRGPLDKYEQVQGSVFGYK